MLEINGKFNTAIVFVDKMEDTAALQIQSICDMEFLSGCKIRIMPDVHAGAGCTIGTTLTINGCVIPNLVGVDIGCGMGVMRILERDIDLPKLDEVIRQFVPCGKEVHEGRIVRFPELQELYCIRELKDTKRMERSIGTLGGGNHFIEVNRDEDGNIYIVVHTGSRNLGKQVADYYQNLAYELLKGKDKMFDERDRIIKEYKEQGRKSEIQTKLKELLKIFEANIPNVPQELSCLTGKYFDMYIHDMKICQEFAELNRRTILSIIAEKMGFDIAEQFSTVHNYIDMETMILRKGAVSAKKGEKLLIPMNMRDGSLLCEGKGNDDWNNSAPHGAGRIMSRGAARARLTMAEYAQSMEGIFTTSINEKTIDEAPQAYKPMTEIIANLGETADIINVIKPIYNFKAGE